MNDEFIECQDFVEDFLNVELELEIDEEFAYWSLKSYSDSHNFKLKLRVSDIDNLKYLSLNCPGTIRLLSPKKYTFINFGIKYKKIFCRFIKFLEFLDLLNEQKSHFTRRIKSTAWSVWRLKSNREKTSIFGGLVVIFYDGATTG